MRHLLLTTIIKHPYHAEMVRFPRQYTFSEFFDGEYQRLLNYIFGSLSGTYSKSVDLDLCIRESDHTADLPRGFSLPPK